MSRLAIGDWVIDPALNQASRGAEVVHLEPKMTEVLLALAQRAGDVVSRETLLSEVWSNVTVSDDVLTQSITKLRQALGDASKESSYIQTIPKRGYRLIAPVRPYAEAGAPPVAAVQASESFRHRRAALWIFAALVVAATAWELTQVMRPGPTILELAQQVTGSGIDDLPEVTVRHFDEIEGDQPQTLLARGFTAQLITDLSRVPGIRVVSRRGPSAAAAQARPNGAGTYVVGGEVLRDGADVRLYVHLTEGASGRTLWSERYDRPYNDLFRLQDDLLRQVLAALQAKVTHAELERQARPYTRNLEAYEHFLRAQSALIVRRKDENEAARQSYLKAIALDPKFARAYAGLALTYAADRRNRWTAGGDAALQKAFDLARTAQQIDPDTAEIYFSLAFVDMERGAFPDAVEALRTALRIRPSYADAFALMGGIQTYRGEPGETIPLIRAAMRLVPDSGHLYFLILGRAYFFLGDPNSALLYLRRAVAYNPENIESRLFLAVTLASAGQRDDALWEANEIRALDPAFNITEWLKSYPLADAKLIRQLTDGAGTIGL